MKIHRYLLTAETEIEKGAVFLNAQPGATGLSAWFLVDPEAPKETRRFCIAATGQELPDAIMDCKHLATIKSVIVCASEAVATALHIFDTTETKEKIPSLVLGVTQTSKDPANWWKE